MLLETFEFPHCNALSTCLLFRKYFSRSLKFVSELKHSFSIKKQIIKCRTSISGTNMTSVVFFHLSAQLFVRK